MTTREARIGLITFGLLFAGLAINLLAFQSAPPSAVTKVAAERMPPAAADRFRRGAGRSAEDASAPSPQGKTGPAPAKTPDPNSVETTRAVQRELRARGYETGSTDGVSGLMTRAAIMAYEHDSGLPLTGEASEDILKHILLGASFGERAARAGTAHDRKPNAEAVIRTVQQALADLGYNPGKADGQLRSETQQAIREFEKNSGLPVTGRISGVLVARLAKTSDGARPSPAR
jgi:peptidoglycan hydrolase-like protein with peptidoglycan-binding domain